MSGAEDRRREASLKSVVAGLAEVTERTQHIVRDEIELAKAEVAEKVVSLGRGAAVGVAAGVFLALAGLFLLHALAFFFWWLLPVGGNLIFVGYLVVVLLLVVFAGLAGYLAMKFVKKGAPPVPTMAVEEAKLLRESVSAARSGTTPPAVPAATGGPARPTGDHGRLDLPKDGA
ncbi:MAG: phage holin family protein [Solirubrobacteraceae bacterium]|nr:phage holin family protein [Solirubrobacteraceae bacterium]